MEKIHVNNRTIFIFLSLLSLTVYLNSFDVPFHYDDLRYLKENIQIKSFSAFWNWLFEDSDFFFTGRAFLLFTFFLNYKLGGLDTFGYHIFNLLIHITNAFLFYLIFFKYAEANKKIGFSLTYLLAAIIFLIHPINTETVTYISSRSSALSACFMLTSMLCFFKSTENKFCLGRYILGIIFFIFGLLTKETTAILPALLVLFDYYFVAKDFRKLLMRFKYYIPYFAVLCFLSFFYIRYITAPIPLAARPWITHILTEIKVFTEYLRLLIFPVGLNFFHDISPSSFIDIQVGVSILTLAMLIVAAIFLKKKNHVISFSILWFFINVAPFLLIRLNDFMAERWIYLASISIGIALSQFLLSVTTHYRRIGISLIVIIIVLAGITTIARNNIYATQISLWEDVVKKSPNNYKPYLNLSRAYKENGNPLKAIEHAKESIKRNGGKIFIVASINMAAAYEDMGDYNKAEEILKAVEKQAFNYYPYYHNLGAVYVKMEKHEKALAAFKKADEIRPRVSTILFLIGYCYEKLNQHEKAKEYFVLATKNIPQNGQEYIYKGRSLLKLGEYDKAFKCFSEAVKSEPLDVNIKIYFAKVLFDNNYYDQAYKHFSTAAKISPNYAPAYKGMGLVMLQKGNLTEAKKHFNKALSFLPPNSPERKEILELLART